MKNKESYLPFFFLCWAFLYSPVVVQSVFPMKEKIEAHGFETFGAKAAKEWREIIVLPDTGYIVLYPTPCKVDTTVTKRANNFDDPFSNMYKLFTYEIR